MITAVPLPAAVTFPLLTFTTEGSEVAQVNLAPLTSSPASSYNLADREAVYTVLSSSRLVLSSTNPALLSKV